jgi:uncharacterized protein (DUF1810 family)
MRRKAHDSGMSDPHDLQRFVDAQEPIYETALGEICSGSKRSHWMWFIFPQLRGLGLSQTAHFYGIASVDEARAYLDHPLLGARLRECVEAILPWNDRLTAEDILGPIDGQKLRSSFTLFDQIERNTLFAAGLELFFGSERDPRTLALLKPPL